MMHFPIMYFIYVFITEFLVFTASAREESLLFNLWFQFLNYVFIIPITEYCFKQNLWKKSYGELLFIWQLLGGKLLF